MWNINWNLKLPSPIPASFRGDKTWKMKTITKKIPNLFEIFFVIDIGDALKQGIIIHIQNRFQSSQLCYFYIVGAAFYLRIDASWNVYSEKLHSGYHLLLGDLSFFSKLAKIMPKSNVWFYFLRHSNFLNLYKSHMTDHYQRFNINDFKLAIIIICNI